MAKMYRKRELFITSLFFEDINDGGGLVIWTWNFEGRRLKLMILFLVVGKVESYKELAFLSCDLFYFFLRLSRKTETKYVSEIAQSCFLQEDLFFCDPVRKRFVSSCSI